MNIICVIQARMGSERLPGKVLKEINSIPLIEYTIERLRRSRYIDDIILATSTLEQDNLLEVYAKENNIKCYRGSENDVLKRYVDCANIFAGDVIIRITGDCPLIDPVVVDNAITRFLMYKYDYLRLDVPETFIRGFDVEAFSKEALQKTWESVKRLYCDEITRYNEHVTLYIYENKEEFKVGYLKGEKEDIRDYRLCVDTQEDFDIVEKIINILNVDELNYKGIINFLDENENVANINQNIVQKSN